MSYVSYSEDYAVLRPENKYKKAEAEMLNCCLPGSFMNCNGGWEYQGFGTCQSAMAQRCSTKWDDNCDAYLGNLTYEEGRSFLDNVSRRKYCTTSSCESKKGFQMIGCKRANEMANPLNPNSYQTDFLQGTDTYFGYNGGTQKNCPRNSPAYMESCSDAQKCMKKNKKDFTYDDPVYQRCKVWGACNQTLRQIPYKDKSHQDPGVIFEGYIM